MNHRLLRFGSLAGAAAALCTLVAVSCSPRNGSTIPATKIAVTTYHYDVMRTGWNSHETVLNPTLQPPGPVVETFQRLHRVPVDDTVYAQPLIVPDVMAAGGKHDIAYVVTENNTIYGIDANSGAILLTRNLGQPVPFPQNCYNNGPNVGIESTPVIDPSQNAMYLMAYIMSKGQPTYRLYDVDIATLQDRRSPVVVSASHRLANGNNVNFNAAVQRQRPALLLADGNVYAGFGSFCDRNVARGWLLGWHAADLSPLPANILTNQEPNSTLSAIWMSGYGIAAVAGHLYFTTGNTPDHNYDDKYNLSESVLKVSQDLTQVLGYFTPDNVSELDSGDVFHGGDQDLGSGGVMILPDQPGGTPHLAAAAGKEGWMYLLNREEAKVQYPDQSFHTVLPVLGEYPIDSCWCGQSYYLNNIVSSGGSQIGVWQIYTSPAAGLTQIAASTDFVTGGDPGFFTAVSSNGSSNVIIWAVSRRHTTGGGPDPTLFAYQPIPGNPQLKQLFKSVAGQWDFHLQNPPDGANSNIVPVVANGHVYVASYREVDIFGFGTSVVNEQVPAVTGANTQVPQPDSRKANAGVITQVQGPRFTMRTPAGAEVRVDAQAALKNGLSPGLGVGETVAVYGSTDAQGVLHADVIRRGHMPRKGP
ncbi:MAG TPA: DUF5666 domain-containing protein [Bryobacteraceae bacterium]|nr:DUF5666 domain-containing protein [Bryobacteraceae bacterium]